MISFHAAITQIIPATNNLFDRCIEMKEIEDEPNQNPEAWLDPVTIVTMVTIATSAALCKFCRAALLLHPSLNQLLHKLIDTFPYLPITTDNYR